MMGNFVSLPTDGPQRDQRLGWTGDMQVFAPTANFLFDTSGLLDGWLKDVHAETLHYDGICPEVVPWIYSPLQEGRDVRAMGIWADCTALTPWEMYRTFGDPAFLERSFESMVAWLEKGVPRGKQKERIVERLDYRCRGDVFRISTGFAGTPLISDALADSGLLHLAYRMLQEGENPSWLYPVKMGAAQQP